MKICIRDLLYFDKELKTEPVEITTAIDEMFVHNNLCELSDT
jgi:hypothetical protein